MEANVTTKPLVRLRNFFSLGTRPVDLKEYTVFWSACSETEKEYYRAAIAKWDGKSHYIS